MHSCKTPGSAPIKRLRAFLGRIRLLFELFVRRGENFMLRIGKEDFLELGHPYNEFRIRRLNGRPRSSRRGITLCCVTTNIPASFSRDINHNRYLTIFNFNFIFNFFLSLYLFLKCKSKKQICFQV